MDNTPFDFWNWIAAGVGSAITALWTWLRQRKKESAETKTAEIENVERAITIWRNLAQDMRKQVDELKVEITKLSERVDELHRENEGLKIKILVLEDENVRLESEIKNVSK